MSSNSEHNIVDEVKKAFICENLTEIVLDMDEIDRHDLKTYVVDHAYRLLSVSFTMFYCVYVYEKKNNLKTGILNDRVRKHFSKLYYSNNITLDLLFFILMELQIESQNSKNSELKYFINNSFSLSYWKEIFKHQIMNDRELKDMGEMLESFELTLNALPFTKITKIADEEEGLSFNVKKGRVLNMNIPSYGLILLDNQQFKYKILDSLTLTDGEYNAVYKFLSINPEYTLPEVIDRKSNLQSVLEVNFAVKHRTNNDGILISKLYGSNFDRIRLLALAISDIVSENDLIEDRVKEQFESLEVFKTGVHASSSTNMTLDNMVTILIIENGPSEVLQYVLDDFEITFNRILENLAMRMDTEGELPKVLEKYHFERRKLVRRYNNDKFTSSQKREEWVNRHKRDLMIQSIVMYVSHQEEEYHHLVESIHMRKTHFVELYKSKKNIDLKIKEANYIFERTFAFLNIFYSGLIGYAEAEVEFETLTEKSGQYNENNAEAKQEVCEAAFVKAATDWVTNYNNQGKSLGSLMSHFQQMMLSTFEIRNHKLNVKKSGRALEKVIGRYKIGNCQAFSSLISGGDNVTLQSMVNNFKHFYTKVILKDDLRTGFERGFKIFEFLMNNRLDIDRDIFSTELSHMPIYPLVIEFSMKKKMKDGYSISSYTVKGLESNAVDVKILSSKQHHENEHYYCIPNVTSSSEFWWIDPFFIKCSKVDSILNMLNGNEFGDDL